MGIVLDSSILVAFERRKFDLERLLAEHSPTAIAGITAAELLIGVERADTPERRSRLLDPSGAKVRVTGSRSPFASA